MFETVDVSGGHADETVETLDVLVTVDDRGPRPNSGEKGIFGRGGGEGSVRTIPVAVLRENLQRMVNGLQQVLGEVQVPEGGMALQQAQVSFEITATGGIALVGTSAQVGAKGAITLTFGS